MQKIPYGCDANTTQMRRTCIQTILSILRQALPTCARPCQLHALAPGQHLGAQAAKDDSARRGGALPREDPVESRAWDWVAIASWVAIWPLVAHERYFYGIQPLVVLLAYCGSIRGRWCRRVLGNPVLTPLALTVSGILFVFLERPCMNPAWPSLLLEKLRPKMRRG